MFIAMQQETFQWITLILLFIILLIHLAPIVRRYYAAKKPKLGSGARFKAVAASARKSGAKNPNAVAAAIGRKEVW